MDATASVFHYTVIAYVDEEEGFVYLVRNIQMKSDILDAIFSWCVFKQMLVCFQKSSKFSKFQIFSIFFVHFLNFQIYGSS